MRLFKFAAHALATAATHGGVFPVDNQIVWTAAARSQSAKVGTGCHYQGQHSTGKVSRVQPCATASVPSNLLAYQAGRLVVSGPAVKGGGVRKAGLEHSVHG